MDIHVAVYRRMLLAYPTKFRRVYGEAMTQLFADLLTDQRQSSQPLGNVRLWVHAFVDTLSSASRERMEETMHNNVALTRALLVAIPIAAYAAFLFAGLGSLLVLVAGIIVLVARRRSLPDALVGSRRGRWWVWTLIGLGMVGSSGIGATLSGDELGKLGWLLFSLLLVAGALIVGASIVRALALVLNRPSTPSVR